MTGIWNAWGGLVWSSCKDEPVPGVRGLEPGGCVCHFLMPGILDPFDLLDFKADIREEGDNFFAHETFCGAAAYFDDAVGWGDDLVFEETIDRAEGLVVLVTIFDVAANDGMVRVKDRFE